MRFTYDFQRHKQEETQIKLASLILQTRLNEALLVGLHGFHLLGESSRLVFMCVLFLTLCNVNLFLDSVLFHVFFFKSCASQTNDVICGD